jgi:hypothetical protein
MSETGTPETLSSPEGSASDAAVKAAADAAVETAKIEADAAVKIAETHAETDAKAIAAQQESSGQIADAAKQSDAHNAELEECRKNIATLTGSVSELTSQIASIRESLTPKAPAPPSSNPEGGARIPESPEARAPAEAPRKRKRLRLI